MGKIELDIAEHAELPDMPPRLPPLHVIVKFGSGVPSDLQGVVLLHMEMELRRAGCKAEVFLEEKPDDSKRRSKMTTAERENL